MCLNVVIFMRTIVVLMSHLGGTLEHYAIGHVRQISSFFNHPNCNCNSYKV